MTPSPTEPAAFFGSTVLARVLHDIAPLKCMDIGARGGVTEDLLPIAAAVEAFAFEPDKEECQRLEAEQQTQPSPWRSLRYVPVALSASGGTRTLYLTKHRGSSSMLRAREELGARFRHLEELFIVEEEVEVPTVRLDDAVAEYGLSGTVFMKIDIEGLELEALQSAPKLLAESLLAIHAEVAFMPTRIDQPTFADIAVYLRDFGFMPMGFPELFHWRRVSQRDEVANPRRVPPYLRAQLVHGDAIFFRVPETMPDDTPEAMQLLLKAAFLALNYRYVDHAFAIFGRPAVREHLRATYGADVAAEHRAMLQHLDDEYRRGRWRRRLIWLKRKLTGRG